MAGLVKSHGLVWGCWSTAQNLKSSFRNLLVIPGGEGGCFAGGSGGAAVVMVAVVTALVLVLALAAVR